MDISEKLNTQPLALLNDDKKHNTFYVYSVDVEHLKLYTIIAPSSSLYRWNDFGKSIIY
jgi:hypothetical protein